MTELLTYIAKALVDKPEVVELRESDAPADPSGAPGGKVFELKVAPEDVGKVIGRDGRTVNAMRTLLAAAAQKKGVKARLEILDDRRNAQAQAPAPASQPPQP